MCVFFTVTFCLVAASNHPIELYGYKTLKQKLNYLPENIISAGIVYESWHYKYSSAIDYCTTMKGKIKLELIYILPDAVLGFLLRLSVLWNT